MTDTNDDKQKTLEAVKERLKFFYSDANVRADYFMRQKLLKSPGGFVPVEILLKFNSIKCHTTDKAVILEAAKGLSDVLTINKDENAVGRATPFKMSQMNDNIPLSLYVTNLPLTESSADATTPAKYAVSVGELRPLFEPFGTVTLIKFRFKADKSAENDEDMNEKSPQKRKKKNIPSGGAFVEYETEKELESAADSLLTVKDGEKVEPSKSLEIGGNKIEVKTMKEWVEEKKSELKEEEQKRKREDDEPKKFSIEWKPGCVISIKGLSDSCDRESIRSMTAEYLGLSEEAVKDKGVYVDFSRGQTHGAVRFNEPSEDIGKLAEKLNSGDVLVAGSKVESAVVLDGDEEKKYWQNFVDFKNKQMRHKSHERSSKKKFRTGRD